MYLFKEPAFVFTDFFSYCFSVFHSNSRLSNLVFTLGLICSSFSSFLRWKLRSMIWDLFYYLIIQTFNAIILPLINTLTTSHIFWYFLFVLSLSIKYFLIFFWSLNWTTGYSEMCYLVSEYSETFPRSFSYRFQI